MGWAQTITGGRRSLARQAGLRLVISLGLFVILLGYASYKAYTVTLQKSAHDRAEYLSNYFHARLLQIDRDWEIRAQDEKTRIESMQLLAGPKVDLVRLQALLTMQDTGKRLQYLLIENRRGDKVFDFGANLSLERIPISTKLDNGWYHPLDNSRLYRVFVVPIWLGKAGMGHMAVFYQVDNALLFNLTSPNITLTVEHDGMQFATSSGRKMQEAEDVSDSDNDYAEARTILWQANDIEETYLRIDAPIQGLFTKTELVIGASIIPVIDGLILLFTFGFWMMRHTQRLHELGEAVQAFSLQPQSIPALQEKLDAAKDAQEDEISEVAVALKDMIGQTLLRERERQEEEAQRRLWSMVFANTNEAILITDRGNNIITVNAAFTRLTGYKEKEVVGENPHILSSGNQTPEFYEAMWQQINENGSWAGEVQDKRKDGSIYPKWLNISVVRDAGGNVVNYIGIFQDITQRKANEERLAFLANHDVLTGLPNRHLLLDRLQNDITLARRTGEPIGLMFLDLDNFKWVNDTLGHASGDQLLIAVATRLKETVRASDTVARLGGDEFVVLLTQTDSDLEIAQIAGKIIASVSRPLDLAGHEFHVTTSMGISVYPNDGDDAATLLKHADTAMYVAKSAGKNQFRYFDPAMNRNALDRVELEQDLRHALKRGEFELHYQPKLCVITHTVIAAEALIRWRHPRQGLLSPDKFIPLAEETSLIIDIGEWAIRSACVQVATWQRQGINMQRVAVNLSALQLESDNFVGTVEHIFRETGVPAKAIEFELTESVVLHNPAKTVTTLNRLHELGIHLALDDFGTGYSSLSYLKRLPVDALKIDRSFVEGLPDDPDDRQIVRMICALAKSVGLEIVAEGIETEAQRHFMIGLECDFLQGYLISKPLPADEFVAFLAEQDGNKRTSQ
jgi:diguanylate cyclase (GGDEF)-like protein/PAS domain S-box-containing protein